MNRKLSFKIIVAVLVISGCASQVAERNNAGNRQLSRNDFEEALKDYQLAQVIAPDRAEAYYNAALAYDGLGEFEQAKSALAYAIETSDEALQVRAYYNMGNIMYRQGQIADAIDAYQQALLIDPEDEDVRYNLEIALLQFVQPTPTAQEQQTEPEVDQTDPDTTPTNQPGGFDGPTPTPPPIEVQESATPVTGEGGGGEEDSSTPVPRTDGPMTVEQAERILDQIEQDQQSLSEFLEDIAASGDPTEKDW